MKALILAAGYATRLYPYTKNFPKPLLEVNEKPIIQYLVEKLEAVAGVSEILVVTNARFVGNFTRWKKKLKKPGKITIVNDRTSAVGERLGAVGDMNFVFRKKGFRDDYLVLGGDNFFKEPLAGFVAQAKRQAPAITIGVSDIRDKREARNYGVVRLDRKHRVAEFREKPASPQTSTVAMCLYYFPRESVALIKDYLGSGAYQSDAAGAYIRWLCAYHAVYGYIFKNYWVDIGRIRTYQQVQQQAKGGTL